MGDEPRRGDPETRRRIIEAACDVIAQRESSSLSCIATRARVSRQTIYLHFGNRAGMLVAVIEHLASERQAATGD
jgi:AcrR family transcriptional regulator